MIQVYDGDGIRHEIKLMFGVCLVSADGVSKRDSLRVFKDLGEALEQLHVALGIGNTGYADVAKSDFRFERMRETIEKHVADVHSFAQARREQSWDVETDRVFKVRFEIQEITRAWH